MISEKITAAAMDKAKAHGHKMSELAYSQEVRGYIAYCKNCYKCVILYDNSDQFQGNALRWRCPMQVNMTAPDFEELLRILAKFTSICHDYGSDEVTIPTFIPRKAMLRAVELQKKYGIEGGTPISQE